GPRTEVRDGLPRQAEGLEARPQSHSARLQKVEIGVGSPSLGDAWKAADNRNHVVLMRSASRSRSIALRRSAAFARVLGCASVTNRYRRRSDPGPSKPLSGAVRRPRLVEAR